MITTDTVAIIAMSHCEYDYNDDEPLVLEHLDSHLDRAALKTLPLASWRSCP